MSAPEPIDREQVEATAARWVMRREEPGWEASDQAELDGWLAQSMAHKAAYWRLDHGWRQADRLRSLGDAVASEHRSGLGTWLRDLSRPLAIAASVALVVVAGFAYLRSFGPSSPGAVEVAQQTVTTATGGHKRIPLPDGSQIELNTQTMLRAAVTPESRVVWLDRGEAFFEVRHSDRVPFVVHAGPRTVTVLGTKFSVRRDGEKVTVAVVEGRVRVDASLAGSPASLASPVSTTVTTGDVAIAEGVSTMVAAKAPERVENALAWRDGMLSFDHATLRDVAGEFNRYNERKLVVVGERAASIRIGGTFQASNVDAFARLLRDAYGLEVQSGERDVKISE